MSAIEPGIEVHGDEKAVSDLQALGERAASVLRLSERVRSIYRKSESARFDSDAHGIWPALAASTQAKKAAQGQDPRAMRVTGALYRALTAPRASGQVDERSQEEFRFGTDLPYARFHDHGTKTMPKRRLIDLQPSERNQISAMISRWIAKGQEQ